MNVADYPGLIFLDTNIFVYSFDQTAPEKRQLAQRLIEDALQSQRAIISSQVVQEFLNVALRKFVRPMTVAEAQEYLDKVLMPLCQHYPTIDFYRQALRVKQETGYSLYDALILTAAIENQCKTLFSEDMQHGRQIQGLEIVNPFV
jgi:predicted nucleic acid-binding protein